MKNTVTTLEMRPFARRPALTFSANSGIRFFQLHARAFPVRCDLPNAQGWNWAGGGTTGRPERTNRAAAGRRTNNDRAAEGSGRGVPQLGIAFIASNA